MKLIKENIQEFCIIPISPLHIGCGEEYTFIHSFIEKNIVYSWLNLDAWADERKKHELLNDLTKIVPNKRDTDFLPKEFANLFAKYANNLKYCAHRPIVSIDAKPWKNVHAIERFAFSKFNSLPIVPGSALKGALRTAWQWQLSEKFPGENLSNLLGGGFSKDPFSLLNISDAIACKPAKIQTHVINKVTRHRHNMSPCSIADGQQNTIEVVLPAKTNVFKFELNIDALGSHPQREIKQDRCFNIDELLNAVHDYTIQTIDGELTTTPVSRNTISPDFPLKIWWAKFKDEIDLFSKNYNCSLIRLGKHTGAESNTLPKYRRIETKRYKKLLKDNNLPTGVQFLPESATLAKFKTQSNEDLLEPFGFALIIPVDKLKYLLKNEETNSFILEAYLPLVNEGLNLLTAHKVQSDAWKAEQQELRKEAINEQKRKIEEEITEQKRIEAEKIRVNSLSENERKIEIYQQKMHDVTSIANWKAEKTNAKWHNEIKNWIKDATNWQDSEKIKLKQCLEEFVPKLIIGFSNKDKEGRKALKALLDPLQIDQAQ